MSPSSVYALSLGLSVVGLCASWRGHVLSRRRLQALTGSASAPLSTLWRRVLGPLAARLEPSPQEAADLLQLLARAGRGGEQALKRFLEERLLGQLLGVACAVPVLLTGNGNTGLLGAAVCLCVGALAPERLVRARAHTRQVQISAALPGAVDLLMTAVDAGLSLEAALGRVADEFRLAAPELAQELALTAGECTAGVPLPEALRRLARRIESDEVSGLCTVLAQSHELGAPVVRTLGEYSENARRLRLSALDEDAGKLSIKLTLPLAFFFLPSMLLMMLGPSGIALMRMLK